MNSWQIGTKLHINLNNIIMVRNFQVSTYSTICDILCLCLVVAYTQDTLHFSALHMFIWLFYGCTLTLLMFLFSFVLRSVSGRAPW